MPNIPPTVQQRILEIYGDAISLEDVVSFSYSWNGSDTGAGYEKLEIKRKNGENWVARIPAGRSSSSYCCVTARAARRVFRHAHTVATSASRRSGLGVPVVGIDTSICTEIRVCQRIGPRPPGVTSPGSWSRDVAWPHEPRRRIDPLFRRHPPWSTRGCLETAS